MPNEPDAGQQAMRNVFGREFSLFPQELVEGEISMSAGATMQLEIGTDTQPISWDVHMHRGAGIDALAQGRDLEVDFELIALETGTYWVTLTNDADVHQTVRVNLRIGRDAVFEGWQ